MEYKRHKCMFFPGFFDILHPGHVGLIGQVIQKNIENIYFIRQYNNEDLFFENIFNFIFHPNKIKNTTIDAISCNMNPYNYTITMVDKLLREGLTPRTFYVCCGDTCEKNFQDTFLGSFAGHLNTRSNVEEFRFEKNLFTYKNEIISSYLIKNIIKNNDYSQFSEIYNHECMEICNLTDKDIKNFYTFLVIFLCGIQKDKYQIYKMNRQIAHVHDLKNKSIFDVPINDLQKVFFRTIKMHLINTKINI